MYLLSWNVRYMGLPKRLEIVADAIASTEPDIVTLQEVSSRCWGQGCRGTRTVWAGATVIAPGLVETARSRKGIIV